MRNSEGLKTGRDRIDAWCLAEMKSNWTNPATLEVAIRLQVSEMLETAGPLAIKESKHAGLRRRQGEHEG